MNQFELLLQLKGKLLVLYTVPLDPPEWLPLKNTKQARKLIFAGGNYGSPSVVASLQDLEIPHWFCSFLSIQTKDFSNRQVNCFEGRRQHTIQPCPSGGYGKNLLARSIIGPSLSYIHRASMAIGCQAAKLQSLFRWGRLQAYLVSLKNAKF